MSPHTSVRAMLAGFKKDTNPTLQDLVVQNPPLLQDCPDAFCPAIAQADHPPARPVPGRVWKGPPILQGGVIHHGQMTITEGHGLR